MPPWAWRRAFPRATLDAIEAAIRVSETRHGGEIRFAIENSLPGTLAWRGMSSRERAIGMFSNLRVWDTEHNSGVLIYLLLADRDVEIVADRGIHAKVGEQVWRDICLSMEMHFRQGRFEQGIIEGIQAITAQLQLHFPADTDRNPNELPNIPVVL